jgi:pimeloyl-ACP methyl ester carboxylesterase
MQALGELIKVSWGSDQPGFRQVYDARFIPDGPLETWRAFDELQRLSTSPENAYQLWRAFGALDASTDAVQLSVPTLILHSTDDQVWRFSEAEELHSLIPGSRLVALESKNHILRADEPAFDRFLHEVRDFLATDGAAMRGNPTHGDRSRQQAQPRHGLRDDGQDRRNPANASLGIACQPATYHK